MKDALEEAVDRAAEKRRQQKVRMEERERCAKIAETEEELLGEPSAEALAAMIDAGPVANARAAVRATKKSIAERIRAANGHG